MYAAVATVFSGAVYETCDAKSDYKNPIRDCLEPLVNNIMSYIVDIALCTDYSGKHGQVRNTEPEDLWYREADFEGFKRDMVSEARDAGCYEPVAQYNHIKTTYVDEITRRNTEHNINHASTALEEEKGKRKSRGHRRSVSFDLNDASSALIISEAPK